VGDVGRLMRAAGRQPYIESLAKEVAAVNPDGAVHFYPGSPVLTARGLGAGDRYVGFEMNPPVRDLLEEALAAWPNAEARGGDGYEAALALAKTVTAPFVLIDPPFERPDDYQRAADTAAAVMRADRKAMVAIWTPLKDMETFDGFMRRIEQAKVGGALAAEARLRPLTNPMKMNGCAMVMLNPPPGAEAAALEICNWVASTLGDPGAKAEVWSIP